MLSCWTKVDHTLDVNWGPRFDTMTSAVSNAVGSLGKGMRQHALEKQSMPVSMEVSNKVYGKYGTMDFKEWEVVAVSLLIIFWIIFFVLQVVHSCTEFVSIDHNY